MAKAPLIRSASGLHLALQHDLVALHLGRRSLRLQEFDQPRRIGELVVVELHRRALRPGIQPADPGALAHRLDPHDQHQRVHLFRQRAEAVDQFGGEAFQLDLGGRPERRR
jgi:hypothetical protein